MKTKKPRHRTTKGRIVLHSLDNIKRTSFVIIRKELRSVLRKYSGIYALYKGSKLVYVGKADNLYGRLQDHVRSKRKDWDTARLFTVNEKGYLRDLETVVNRIARPKYSIQRGRVKEEHTLQRVLRKRVKEYENKLKKRTSEKSREIDDLEKKIEMINKALQ